MSKDGRVLRTDEKKNLVAYAGIEKMFKRLADETNDNLRINIAALGTGTSTPGTGNTGLQTETYRNLVISATASGNQLFIDALFTAEEVDGVFREFGLFVDGADDTPGSGTLWNRVSVNWTKTNEESLFVRGVFTIENV